MRTATRSQINRYYKLYPDSDVIFNTRVIRFLGLVTKNVYLKNRLEITPCVIYSASMLGARVIADLSPGFFSSVKLDSNIASLHFSFQTFSRPHPASFFITGRIEGYSQYKNDVDKNYYLISLTYIKRPSDEYLGMLGRIIESNTNAQKWRDVRITALPRAMREIDLDSSDTIIELESKPRKCIIRNRSFSGAKVTVEEEARKIVRKDVVLYIPFGDQKELIKINGTAVRFDDIDDSVDLVGLSIVYNEQTIPLAYTVNLNEYLLANQVRDE